MVHNVLSLSHTHTPTHIHTLFSLIYYKCNFIRNVLISPYFVVKFFAIFANIAPQEKHKFEHVKLSTFTLRKLKGVYCKVHLTFQYTVISPDNEPILQNLKSKLLHNINDTDRLQQFGMILQIKLIWYK